jgi:p-hydroxybenzoate 3-monooxygenase
MGRGLETRTQVGIVGAGPAGLILGHLLHLQGIESVILEARSREHVEQRVRAGVLEQRTVDLLIAMGVGERLQREALVHRGLELRFNRIGHRIPLDELTGGRTITIYGQQEVVKDLIQARVAANAPLLFNVGEVAVDELESNRPAIHFNHDGRRHVLQCDFIAGCDGYHGVCRESIPVGVLTFYTREYPFSWLGILARVAPSSEELVYTFHHRGFALHSLRSPELSRLYLQCDPEDDLDQWPDDRIWEELHVRLAREDGWSLKEGPIIERLIAPLRSFVAEPMQFGRLYLAGDAAHIVPATGAKGLNLAVADVRILADAVAARYRDGDETRLNSYSESCLRRVWRIQHFSWWMTSMLHRFPDDEDGLQARLQLAQLEYVCSSRAAATTLAENYVGLERVPGPLNGLEGRQQVDSQLVPNAPGAA